MQSKLCKKARKGNNYELWTMNYELIVVSLQPFKRQKSISINYKSSTQQWQH